MKAASASGWQKWALHVATWPIFLSIKTKKHKQGVQGRVRGGQKCVRFQYDMDFGNTTYKGNAFVELFVSVNIFQTIAVQSRVFCSLMSEPCIG